jgi:hypothetical protein
VANRRTNRELIMADRRTKRKDKIAGRMGRVAGRETDRKEEIVRTINRRYKIAENTYTKTERKKWTKTVTEKQEK